MTTTIKKISFLAIGMLVMALIIGQYAMAGTTASVTATVTVQNISLSVADGGVTYGTLGQNNTKSTCSSELNDAQTVTNDGNITANFNIKGQNSANWTLGTTAASDVYVHQFKNGTCATFSAGTALTVSYQALATSIATSGTATLNLQINTPNPSTVFTQQSVDVMVQAVAP